MSPAELADAVLAAARSLFEDRGWDAAALPASTSVERPRNPEHGDYASTLALQLAKKAGVPPQVIAQGLASKLTATPGIKTVDIAGPGFLNIRLDAAAAGELARTVVTQGREYGRGAAQSGCRTAHLPCLLPDGRRRWPPAGAFGTRPDRPRAPHR